VNTGSGPPFVKKKIKAVKPGITRGDSFKLVTEEAGCTCGFSEQKEVKRHLCNMQPAFVRLNIQVMTAALSDSGKECRGYGVNRHMCNTYLAYIRQNLQVVTGALFDAIERNVGEMEGQGDG
jgi:hypothetical protein